MVPCPAGGAHPRSCGENASQVRRWLEAKGSSPLMRGKLRCRHVAIQHDGLIPAHAGKTLGDLPGEVVAGAHPRSCGENMQAAMQTTRDNGSSPLMRGKRRGRQAGRSRRRLIPAHAGKTRAGACMRLMPRAHPRSCGENARFGRADPVPLGSSPLMRGKQSHLPGRET